MSSQLSFHVFSDFLRFYQFFRDKLFSIFFGRLRIISVNIHGKIFTFISCFFITFENVQFFIRTCFLLKNQRVSLHILVFFLMVNIFNNFLLNRRLRIFNSSERSWKPKITNLYCAVLINKDIGRLQVSMNDICWVKVL